MATTAGDSAFGSTAPPFALPATNGRSYALQVYAPHAPRSVTQDGRGELPRRTPGDGQGWWHDGGSFVFVRVLRSPAAVTIAW